jgi:glycosyltransferase involved in cell wall biosynthesis
MSAHVNALGYASKTHTSYGGTQCDPHAPVSAAPDRKKKMLLYAGTLGRANAIPLLVSAAETLAHRDDHEFVFLGSGYHAATVRQAADRLPNVRFLGEQPSADMHRWFCQADLSLVTFGALPVLAANSPSKLYDSLAAGTPVVVNSSGWTRALVERTGAGWFLPPDDPEAFARGIARLLDDPERLRRASDQALAFARDPSNALMFSRDAQAEQYLDLFEQVLAEQRG